MNPLPPISPMAYSPGTDDGVALVLLCCFFMTAYVLSRSRKFLAQLLKDFLLNRERTSLFAESTPGDMRCLLLLVLQTGVLAGLAWFNYFALVRPSLVHHAAPAALLAIYVGASLAYLLLKWLLYGFIGWIFFDIGRRSLWMESYSTLIYYAGLTLFPYLLVAVYFDLGPAAAVCIGLIIAVFIKILMLYKWLKLFLNNLHGLFYLILYFCALEIVPCLMLGKALIAINDYLIIKT